MAKDTRLVWDLPTRLFHWLLVATIVSLYFTAQPGDPTWMPWHMRLGYFALGLVSFRLIWGFVGPRHARFVNFLKGPGPILQYMRGGIKAVGHNPMGGWMVVLMLVLVGLQATTGLFATDDIAFTGPYNGAADTGWVTRVAGWLSHLYFVHADGAGEKLTAIHHRNFYFGILAVVVLHLCAITLYTFVFKEKLVPAMVHGHKDAEHVPAAEAISSHELLKALIVIAVVAGGIWYLLHVAPPPPAISFN